MSSSGLPLMRDLVQPLGVMLFLQNMGPGMGFLIGSLTTTMYVDFDKVDVGETN